MSDAAIEITDLRVKRGTQLVLDGLNLSVPAGVITGLLGPSGSGKTTLMRAIVGSQRVQSGSVRVLDLPAGSRPLRSRIGYVTQAASVYDDLTVEQNLRYFARILGVPRSAVTRAIGQVDLADEAQRRVDSLSGGQRNRVSLAIALLGDPDLLVLDEPTVGLDPVLRRDLWKIFSALAASGKTLLVSSHVMDEARNCQQLILMRNGEILLTDTPDGLLRRTGVSDPEDAFLALIEAEVPA